MINLNESAILAAAEAMRDAEIEYTISLYNMVNGVSKEYTVQFSSLRAPIFFPSHAAASEFVERERNLAKAKAAVEAYLAGMGDGWIEIQDAPKDCLIAAICWHPPFGSYEGKWVGPEFYAWNEAMKYWDNKQRGTCIWPQYHDRYRCRSLGSLPPPPSIPSDEGSEKP